MTNKEKLVSILSLIHLILLMACLLMMFLCIFLNVDTWVVFVFIFIAVLIIGFIIINILKMTTYNYECEECHNLRSINFIETIFTPKGKETRVLKCPHCQKQTIMKRIPK